MRVFRLIRLLVFRSMKEEKLLSFLSILGVALGIGLFVGVRAASDRAIASFEGDIQGINPRVTHEIIARSGVDFPDHVYALVRRAEDDSFPILRTTGYIQSSGTPIQIIGLYTVRAVSLAGEGENGRYDMEGYYRTPNGVLIPASLARKLSVGVGGVLRASVYDRIFDLKIIGILNSQRIPGDTLIMDLGNFQEFLGRVGYLTKIDLVVDDREAEKIEEMLPDYLTVQRKEKVIENQRALMASFRYNLLFVSLIAVLVGIFLLYNTIFVSMVKRRREIGILRGLGIGRKTVMALFTIQGLFLGITGSLIGAVLGQFFAFYSIKAVENTVSTIYGGVSLAGIFLAGKDILSSLGLGFSVSLVASVIPAYESSKVMPCEALHEGSFEGKYKEYQKVLSSIGVLSIAGGGVVSYIDYRVPPFDFPYLAYCGVLLLILGFTLLSPLYLRATLRVIKSPISRVFKGSGKLATGEIGGSLYRFSVALMSVAISSALVFALLTSIYSLRSSLKMWIDRNITADVFIKPASCLSNYCYTPLSREVVEVLENYPEVAGVDRFRVLQVELFGKKVVAGFGETNKLRKFGNKKYFKEGDAERLMRLENAKEVSISDYLSVKYNLKKGDEVVLRTPRGREAFTVNNSFISYSTTGGFVYLDRRWLREFWGLNDATQVSIYLKEGRNVSQFIEKLRNRFSRDYSLEIMNNRELRERILSIFNKSFSITYAIELIAIVVSLIGMVNALLVLVLEKRRELSIIRYLGGSFGQIRNMIVLAAGVIGMAGVLLGTVMGPIISTVIIHVINRLSFGWDVSVRVPLLPLICLMGVLFVTSLTAGYIPTNIARKLNARDFISFE